jgi:hypothetical protein
MSGEECSREGVVELTVVVTLDYFDDVVKLCEDKGEKIDKVENESELTRKGKVHTK